MCSFKINSQIKSLNLNWKSQSDKDLDSRCSMTHDFLENCRKLCGTRHMVHTSDVIFSGTFSFSSPGTFWLFKSRDFLVPGPSGSLGPVLLCPRTFPGLPGTSRDLYFYSFAISWSRHYPLDFYDTFYFLLRLLSELDYIFQSYEYYYTFSRKWRIMCQGSIK